MQRGARGKRCGLLFRIAVETPHQTLRTVSCQLWSRLCLQRRCVPVAKADYAQLSCFAFCCLLVCGAKPMQTYVPVWEPAYEGITCSTLHQLLFTVLVRLCRLGCKLWSRTHMLDLPLFICSCSHPIHNWTCLEMGRRTCCPALSDSHRYGTLQVCACVRSVLLHGICWARHCVCADGYGSSMLIRSCTCTRPTAVLHLISGFTFVRKHLQVCLY